ncbi:MAG: hypothetical protein JXB39_13395 [Deltaproteobacteria bacterium]|nr:hypothetical protein [Deltaproteobacteria bacterium]
MFPRPSRILPLLVLAGCALHGPHVGILRQEDAAVVLDTPQGRTRRLLLDEDLRVVRSLAGCTVALDGPRFGPLLIVRSWSVTDAGDGSAPFVGRLSEAGLRLLLEDRNSGLPVFLAPDAPAELRQAVGRLVLVAGYVVGPQEVRVVHFRILSE